MVELNFEQEIVLVIIPTIAGILTSKWVTNSWQERKEKLELRKRILDEFNEGLPTILSIAINQYSIFNKGLESYDISYKKEFEKFEDEYHKQYPPPEPDLLNIGPFEEYERKLIEKFMSEHPDSNMESQIKKDIQKQNAAVLLARQKAEQFNIILPLYFRNFKQLREKSLEIYAKLFAITNITQKFQFKQFWFDKSFHAEIKKMHEGFELVLKLIDELAFELVNSKINNPKM